MKYIISEKQFKLISEISRMSGNLGVDPLDDLFDYYEYEIPNKQKYHLFLDFFKKKLGFKIPFENKNELKYEIQEYFENPSYNAVMGRAFHTKDSISAFSYFIAKEYFGFQEGIDLKFIINDREASKIYYFFDPQLKIFVGKIVTGKNDDFPYDFDQVQLSAADDELIGTGYGLKMYLNVINEVDYLVSDSSLYAGSYRMWKHILPKYCNVWGLEKTGIYELKFTKMTPQSKRQTQKFDNFVASIKFNKIHD